MVKIVVTTTGTIAKQPTRRKKAATAESAPAKHKLSKRSKILLTVLGVCALFFVVLNWGFVRARVVYLFHKPDPATVFKPLPNQASPKEGAWPKNNLAIPELGIVAPIVYGVNQNEEAFQAALKNGVVHYPGSAQPGKVGNVFIFGHSSDYAWNEGEYKSVFALLPKIDIGAEIKLTDSKGFAYTYLVTEKFVVGPKDVGVLSQETEGKKMLTLQTSYPIGTALKRYIVRAQLRQSD